jgi:hypothetical protein
MRKRRYRSGAGGFSKGAAQGRDREDTGKVERKVGNESGKMRRKGKEMPHQEG